MVQCCISVMDGKHLYVGFGFDGDEYLNDLHQYDPGNVGKGKTTCTILLTTNLLIPDWYT